MAPRAYNNETRLQQQAELKSRIAAAASRLHAEKGALGTSWADIAAAAGVSLPTVYKHFPDLDALIPACTAHAAAGAPPLPIERLLASADLGSAIDELVAAADRLNAYYAPWMAWGEHQRIPALAALIAQERRRLTGLCSQILQRHLGQEAADLRDRAAAWEALLNFSFWSSLVREHRLSRAAARRLTAHLLQAAAGPRPANDPPARPNRKATP